MVLCFDHLQIYYLKKLEMKMEILLPFSQMSLNLLDEIPSHQFSEFQHLLDNFWAKVTCYILYFTHVQYPRGKPNWVWAHAAFGLD